MMPTRRTEGSGRIGGSARRTSRRRPTLRLHLGTYVLAVSLAASLAPAAAVGQGVSSLAGTSWQLVEFQSMDDAIGVSRPTDGALYTMELAADGSVSMQLNCNRAAGTWTALPAGDGTSGSFELGPLAMTRALCPPPSMDASIAAQAEYIRSYLLRDGRLYLSLMADGGIYTWEPRAPSIDFVAAEAGGPRVFEVVAVEPWLNLRADRSTAAPVLARFESGARLDNLGCEIVAGRTWCDVQRFGGGPRGYVAADYLRGAVAPDGSIPTGEDDSALRAGQRDFDATGNLPCAAAAGQPTTSCEFGVARAGGGFATVVVTRPSGLPRAIYFRMGLPIGANTSQADGYPELRATKESDLHLIRVGDERYEIPDAVVFGG